MQLYFYYTYTTGVTSILYNFKSEIVEVLTKHLCEVADEHFCTVEYPQR
jgi:hypothetical protein